MNLRTKTIERASLIVTGVVAGAVFARLPVTWTALRDLDWSSVLSTTVGTSIPAFLGYGLARTTAISSTKALARATMEASDDYAADSDRQRRLHDRLRQRQWAVLRNAIDEIPGATEPRAAIRLTDYHRVIDVLADHLSGFASLYDDVDHAELLLAGLSDRSEDRARRRQRLGGPFLIPL